MAKRKYKKATPWNKIKADYLTGVTPKELGEKYNIEPKTISDKAYVEKWTIEKTKIYENLRVSVEDEIKNGSTEAVQYLRQVVNNPLCETKDRISAAKGILEVSGLKSSKQEITGKDGSDLIQKVYITQQEQVQADRHIDSVIDEQ